MLDVEMPNSTKSEKSEKVKKIRRRLEEKIRHLNEKKIMALAEVLDVDTNTEAK